MILDLFINQSHALKKGIEPQIPKKFSFLTEHHEKFNFVTSFFTKAEVMRELVAGHGMKQEMVNSVWDDFMEILKPKYINSFVFDDKIVDIVAMVGMKLRTMINFLHIFIAMKEDTYFVSGDKAAIDTSKLLNVHNKVLTYIELRKLAANYADSSSDKS